VLLSNLGLTVFVRHLVELVKQVPMVCAQGRKELRGYRPQQSPFLSLTTVEKIKKTMPSDAPSLLIENIYVSQDI
jgi:hypothetical protein